MPENVSKNQQNQLTLAIARGESITGWAHRNGVPLSTAFRWSRDPKVRSAVEAWRHRALDRTIGRMASLALKATDGITRLAKEAESESVQLRAWRAIMADQMAVAKFSDLEYRMTEIEEQVDERNRHAEQAGYGDLGQGEGRVTSATARPAGATVKSEAEAIWMDSADCACSPTDL